MSDRSYIQMLNGVNITELEETVGAIQETPSLADFRFRVSNRWRGGGESHTIVRASYGVGKEFPARDGKFSMDADEPIVFLGQDRAANPVEYFLHALAACVTTSAVYHAAARGIEVDSVESQLEGQLDAHGFLGLDSGIRNGFQKIRMTMTVTGDLTEEQVQEVIDLGTRYSPVYDMVTQSVPVVVTRGEPVEIERAA